MAYPVVHFEVTGKDLGALTTFYSELFGWKVNSIPEMNYAIVEKEEGGIGGGIGVAPEGSPGQVTFYIGTDDLQGVLDKAESLGGTTIMPVTELPEVTIALFADPEGHVIGVAGGM